MVENQKTDNHQRSVFIFEHKSSWYQIVWIFAVRASHVFVIATYKNQVNKKLYSMVIVITLFVRDGLFSTLHSPTASTT